MNYGPTELIETQTKLVKNLDELEHRVNKLEKYINKLEKYINEKDKSSNEYIKNLIEYLSRKNGNMEKYCDTCDNGYDQWSLRRDKRSCDNCKYESIVGMRGCVESCHDASLWQPKQEPKRTCNNCGLYDTGICTGSNAATCIYSGLAGSKGISKWEPITKQEEPIKEIPKRKKKMWLNAWEKGLRTNAQTFNSYKAAMDETYITNYAFLIKAMEVEIEE